MPAPAPAIVSTATRCPLAANSWIVAGVRPTRYSSVFLANATPLDRVDSADRSAPLLLLSALDPNEWLGPVRVSDSYPTASPQIMPLGNDDDCTWSEANKLLGDTAKQ